MLAATRARAAQPLVETESEELVQQVLPCLRLVVEKACERPLWKDDASRELIEREADAVDNRVGDLGRTRCNHFAARFEARFLRRSLARVRCRAPYDSGGRVVLSIEREMTADARLHLALADHRLDQLLVVEAGNASVEGEDHRVDDARLARPGRAHDDEEVGVLEVDDNALPVGGETLKLDPLRFHAPPPVVP